MSLINSLINLVIKTSQEAEKEKRRQELRKGSIDIEHRLISETVIESKEMIVK